MKTGNHLIILLLIFFEWNFPSIPITSTESESGPASGLNLFSSIMLRAAIANPDLRTDEIFLSELAKHNINFAETLRNMDDSTWEKIERTDSRIS